MYSIFFDGYRLRINTSDGMLHPAKTEGERARVPEKVRGEPQENIQRCLNCTADRCNGGYECPMSLKTITQDELETFREWVIDRVTGDAPTTFKRLSVETRISRAALQRLKDGFYPTAGVQNKIRAWFDKINAGGENDGDERINASVANVAESL